MKAARNDSPSSPARDLHHPSIREDLRHSWRSARDAALIAYRCWTDAEQCDRQDAYLVYIAAEEQEAAAAEHMRIAFG
jgi:hypothetical protein